MIIIYHNPHSLHLIHHDIVPHDHNNALLLYCIKLLSLYMYATLTASDGCYDIDGHVEHGVWDEVSRIDMIMMYNLQQLHIILYYCMQPMRLKIVKVNVKYLLY